MNKKRQVYLRPAISIVEAAPGVILAQSDIVHRHPNYDDDITIDGYTDDGTVSLSTTTIGVYSANSAKSNRSSNLWDD